MLRRSQFYSLLPLHARIICMGELLAVYHCEFCHQEWRDS